MSERAAINEQVKFLLNTRQYAALEKMAEDFNIGHQRTPSGLWTLNQFHAAVAGTYDIGSPDPAIWEQAEALAAGWTQQFPNSASAHIGYAQMLFAHGWAIRGGGYADTVSAQNWQPFFDYCRKALAHLEAHADIAAADPRYDLQRLNILNSLQVGDDEYDAAADAALDRHPQFYQLYFAIMGHKLPKWGGDIAEIEAFAQQSVERTRSSEGFGLYARIYWAASQSQFGDRLFDATKVRWDDMKRGIGDVLKSYGGNWNVNNFAKFACLAGDRELARSLVERITEPEPEAWDGGMSYDDCKSWAEES